MFVCGDVVYAQTWQVLTLKNCMEPFSYASTAYLVASALVSVRLFCKNLGNLQKFFGQMVYRPPWQKIARMPMLVFHSILYLLQKTFFEANFNSSYDIILSYLVKNSTQRNIKRRGEKRIGAGREKSLSFTKITKEMNL